MNSRNLLTYPVLSLASIVFGGCILFNDVENIDRTYRGVPPIEFRVSSQSSLDVSNREIPRQRITDAISRSLLQKGVSVGPGGLQLFLQVRQFAPRKVSLIQGMSVWASFLSLGIVPAKTMTVENQVYVVVGKAGQVVRSFQYDFDTWGLAGTLLICALQFDNYPDKASEALELLVGHVLMDMEEGGLFEQNIAPASRYDRLVVLKDGRSFLHVQTSTSGERTIITFRRDRFISVPASDVVRNEIAAMPGF
ncbi:MAG: hypothetical protein CMF59_03490 [Leptospiraceae bacterium]|nr:hypothetical protein [Leptospiraceae bacterium]